MNIDERLEALTHTVELLGTLQQTTERNLNRLTREVRLFRHFVLSMGANIEARLLNLEGGQDDETEGGQG